MTSRATQALVETLLAGDRQLAGPVWALYREHFPPARRVQVRGAGGYAVSILESHHQPDPEALELEDLCQRFTRMRLDDDGYFAVIAVSGLQ